MFSHKPNNTLLGLKIAKLNTKKTTLALSIPSLLLGQFAMAQENEAITLDTLQVEERTVDTNPYAEKGAPYKAKISGDSRHVKALAETPQTISVLTQTLIKESGKTDLRDIVAAQPGITLGTGENGNAFGDRYIIRGHEARSDVFVDGLRDPGMTTRESFAAEQIEITKGPSSTFAGRGSTGGAINGITKQASTDYDFNKIEAGLGTDNYGRLTIDSNKTINDDVAVRANILYSKQDVPDRNPADKERMGFALSGGFQATDKLKVVADYYYLDAEDSPDLGSYHLADAVIAHDIPSYVQDEDFLESTVNVGTIRLTFDAKDSVKIENSMRYGTTDNGYVTTGSRGSSRDATDPLAPGAPTITIEGRAHQGWQEVEYFVNQFNVFIDTDLSNAKHQFVFGAEYSDIDVINGTYDVNNTGATNCVSLGRRGPSDSYCILDGNGNELSGINSLIGREITKQGKDSDYSVQTISLSIMDTITLNDHLSLFLGLRADRFDYQNDVLGRGATVPTEYSYTDTLWNGHVGAVFNINEDANVYLTLSTSSNINGGESDLGGNCGYGGLCGADNQQVKNSKPEDTVNIELGTKWNIFNDKLLLTAAIFQITKDDVMETVDANDYASTGSLNTGKNRVEGVEVSAVGNLTEKLSIQLGAALMNAEILESYNDGVHIINGYYGPRVTSDDRGETLANFTDNSAYLQLRYQVSPKLSVGGVGTYASEMYIGQPDRAAGDYEIPSYSKYDLFANYAVNEQLNVRLNVGNVTDKNYYLAGYRSGGFVYIGDARNAQMSVSYEF